MATMAGGANAIDVGKPRSDDAREPETSPYGADFSEIYGHEWDVWARSIWPSVQAQLPRERAGKAWLDLCCGSGLLMQLVVREGFDVVGVDRSRFQLANAAKKVPEAKLIEADIVGLKLHEKFDVATSIFDSLNYITSLDDLRGVIEVVAGALNPGGFLLFDLKTAEGFRAEVGRVYKSDHRVVVFESFYDEESALHRFDVTGFVADGERYRRFDEAHLQRAYKAETVENELRRNGFDVAISDLDRGGPPSSHSRRLVFCARLPA